MAILPSRNLTKGAFFVFEIMYIKSMNTCINCKKEFKITEEKRNFLDKMSPIFDGVKYNIPEPTRCSECRQKRRLSFRNERSLYSRNCDLTNKRIISVFDSNKSYKVYSQEAFFGDEWSALDYGVDFDFTKTFTEQFNELLHKVPHLSSVVVSSENCEYTSFCVDSKDCYLSQRLGNAERVYYTYLAVENCLDCVDCMYIVSCELCYEVLDSEKLYNCVYAQNCKNCSDLYFCFDLVGCRNCFGSINLRNKEYYFFNKQLTQDEYLAEVQKYLLDRKSFIDAKEKFEEFKLQNIHQENSNLNIENVVGDRVRNSKNIYFGFDSDYVEDGIYINGCEKGRDLMDGDFLFYGEKAYEQCSCSHSQNLLFSFVAFNSNDILYSFNINSSSNLFGCCNMKNAKYCILNKQYSKEEYEKLVPKIIQHMIDTKEYGEFLNDTLSPFEYTDTIADEYYPMKTDVQSHIVNLAQQSFDVPDSISETDESICGEVLKCRISDRVYKIILNEFKFYKKMNIPIPLRCPNVRYKERLTRRNPRKLWGRECQKCQRKIQTTYSPERKEIVYCKKCYIETVY